MVPSGHTTAQVSLLIDHDCNDPIRDTALRKMSVTTSTCFFIRPLNRSCFAIKNDVSREKSVVDYRAVCETVVVSFQFSRIFERNA